LSAVVFLDDGDNIGKIQAKLAGASADEVVLVVPKGLQALRNPVWLQLIVRYAHSLAKDLVLIAEDRKTREIAQEQGILVYASRRVLRDPSRLGRLFQGSKLNLRRGLTRCQVATTLPTAALAVFAIGVLALPIVGGYLLLPTATVTVSPVTQMISDTVTITATQSVRKAQPANREVPARALETIVEGTDRVTATGQRPSPDARAFGQITIMNKDDTAVVIRKGTLVATPEGVKFLTVDDVNVPASLWSTARVGIIAADPGASGNVGPLTINQILDPALAPRLTVLNENATQGGTDKQVSFVTAQDHNKLKGTLLERLKTEGVKALQGQRKENEMIYPQTISIVVTEESFDRNIDEEGDAVSLRMKALLTGLAFDDKEVSAVATQALKEQMPPDLQIVPGALKVQHADPASWDQEKVVFPVAAQAEVTTALDEAKIKQQLRGLGREDAESYLAQNLRLTTAPTVQIEPSWVTKLPWIDWRIQLKVVPAS